MQHIRYLFLAGLSGCLATLLIFGCSGDTNKQQPSDSSPDEADQAVYRFDQIAAQPTISDTTAFVRALGEFLNQEGEEGLGLAEEMEKWDARVFLDEFENIDNYERLQVFGADQEVVILEVKTASSAMVSYPWRTQFLFTSAGQLLGMFNAEGYSTLKVHDSGGPY